MSTLSLRTARAVDPADIQCPTCKKLIWANRDRMLLARVTRFPESGPAEACCKICKTWVKVPVKVAGGATS